MPNVQIAGLPPGLVLESGCTIELHAVDPVSNGAILGVVFEQITIWVEGDVGDQSGAFSTGPFMLVPGPGA